MPFPITCTACQKTFSIADDVYERKVKGRVVTIKCKQCQTGIRVDGTKDTLVTSASDSVRPPDVAHVPPPAPVAAPEPAPVAKAAAPAAAFSSASKMETLPSAPAAKAAPKGLGVLGARTPTAAPAGSTTKTPIAAGPKAPAAAPKVHAPLGPKGSAGAAAKVTALSTTVNASPAALAPKAAAPAPAPPTAPVPLPEPAPVAATPAHAPAVETLWAVDYPDGQDRELTVAELEKNLASGSISLTTLVWREGMGEWLELGQVADLKSITARATPAPIPEPPAQRPKALSAPALDLPKLGGLPKPRPPAPSAPMIDFPLREATSSAPPPPATKPRSPTMAGIGDLPLLPTPPAPMAEAIAPALAFPPPAPVMVPAPALAAPFAAPVQSSFARPSPTPVGATAPVANVPDWPQKKSRAPLIIGGVLLVAMAAGAFFMLGSSDDKLPPPVPISALPAAVPTTPRAAVAEAQAAADAPSNTGEGQGARTAVEPPSALPTATPNAGFAELFASGARHADGKGPGPKQRFDQSAANKALAASAFETAKCREKGGPAGKATLVVTFAPSGQVASATVSDPPFAGTSSGACIAAAMKKATVPAFSGLPGTVTKIISIQ